MVDNSNEIRIPSIEKLAIDNQKSLQAISLPSKKLVETIKIMNEQMLAPIQQITKIMEENNKQLSWAYQIPLKDFFKEQKRITEHINTIVSNNWFTQMIENLKSSLTEINFPRIVFMEEVTYKQEKHTDKKHETETTVIEKTIKKTVEIWWKVKWWFDVNALVQEQLEKGHWMDIIIPTNKGELETIYLVDDLTKDELSYFHRYGKEKAYFWEVSVKFHHWKAVWWKKTIRIDVDKKQYLNT